MGARGGVQSMRWRRWVSTGSPAQPAVRLAAGGTTPRTQCATRWRWCASELLPGVAGGRALSSSPSSSDVRESGQPARVCARGFWGSLRVRAHIKGARLGALLAMASARAVPAAPWWEGLRVFRVDDRALDGGRRNPADKWGIARDAALAWHSRRCAIALVDGTRVHALILRVCVLATVRPRAPTRRRGSTPSAIPAWCSWRFGF
jgi:hypothetical protein